MPDNLLPVLVPLGLLIAGLAVLWGQSRRAPEGRTPATERRVSLVAACGWILLLLGLFAAVGMMTHFFFIVAWIATAVVLLSLLFRLRSAERRSLLWMLMLAAERRIPLETAARAFAEERHDQTGGRALDLAEYLEAGLPLALALNRSRLSFPHAVLLAAELGQQTDNLGGALRQALGHADESEVILRSATERAYYLVFLILFGLAMWAFLMIKIIPKLQIISIDFESPLPPMTIWLIDAADSCAVLWPIGMLLLVLGLIALVRSLAYYTGYSPRYLPGLGAGWHRADRSVIMRWLALAVRQNRPLPEMMRLISGYLKRRGLRRKLESAAKQIDRGADWTECLRQAGLIRTAEAAVFRSAQRADNLAWALEEMAQSSVRRSVYQLRATINLAFPAAIAVMGGSVLLVMLGVLIPLFGLIQALS